MTTLKTKMQEAMSKDVEVDWPVIPVHYCGNGIECIDAMKAMVSADEFVAHCRLTSIKYLWRAGKKGPAIDDLRKAVHYLEYAIDTLGGEI
jgi:hypothetical protein